jgi:hypothetical protein
VVGFFFILAVFKDKKIPVRAKPLFTLIVIIQVLVDYLIILNRKKNGFKNFDSVKLPV